jgi:hypothetical protein
MEAIPLSETFVATCVKALTFTWIYRFGVSKTIFLIVGCNLCPNLWLQLCEMLNISNKQNNVLSQTVQSKGCTAASRTRFAHMPLQQHGPRNYPLYSLELEHSRGKTLVFPQLRQFSVHKLSCQMNFCKMTKFQLTLLSKKFPISCMFLLLLCLGTILVLTCLASCQPSCSLPPSSGSVEAAWFKPFSRSTTAPTRFCAVAPAPSPSELGRGTRWSPSAFLRLARQRTPRLAARVAAADCWARAQGVLPQPSGSERPAGIFTFFWGAALLRSWNRFLPSEEVFARPGPTAPSQPPQTWYPSCQRAPPQRLDF